MFAAAIPLAISGISALSGLFANRKQQQQQESTSRQVEDINQLTAPEYDQKTKAMRDILMNQYLDRLGDNQNFFQGYQRQGLSDINRGSDLAGESINNMLASRGLGGTTAGSYAQVANQLNRSGQQNQFLNQIPLLADQRQSNLLEGAAGFFKGLPVGQRQTGQNVTTTTSKGTATIPGNMTGGAVSGLANSLMGLYGQGAFGGPPAQRIGYNPYPLTTPTNSPINYNLTPPPGFLNTGKYNLGNP